MEKVLLIDFPDLNTADIFSKKYFNTAKILGVDYKYSSAEFGDGKYQLKVYLRGNKAPIKEFVQFINKTVTLAEDVIVREGHLPPSAPVVPPEVTFTATEVKKITDPMMELCKSWQGIAEDWRDLYLRVEEDWQKKQKEDRKMWFILIGSTVLVNIVFQLL